MGTKNRNVEGKKRRKRLRYEKVVGKEIDEMQIHGGSMAPCNVRLKGWSGEFWNEECLNFRYFNQGRPQLYQSNKFFLLGCFSKACDQVTFGYACHYVLLIPHLFVSFVFSFVFNISKIPSYFFPPPIGLGVRLRTRTDGFVMVALAK